MISDNEEIWEQIHLVSNIHKVGDPYPDVDFDFYIQGISEKNAYCSNEGIKRQIKEAIELKPEREKVVYFYYKRNNL